MPSGNICLNRNLLFGLYACDQPYCWRVPTPGGYFLRAPLRLKKRSPIQSPSVQNRKIGSDWPFYASGPLEKLLFN
jgi:hypothetical protein